MSDKDRREVKSKLKLNALGHFYNDIYFFIIPFLLPLFREEFGINYIQSGLILTVHVALRSIFSLIFGYLGDKYEKKVIIKIIAKKIIIEKRGSRNSIKNVFINYTPLCRSHF